MLQLRHLTGSLVLVALVACSDPEPPAATTSATVPALAAVPAPAAEATPAATPVAADTASPITGERIAAADREPGNWMSHGRNHGEQRFSPLDQVNADTIKDLKLAWYFDLDNNRGVEATPIVVDGVMYTTASWSVVYALDAKTGKQLWKYDPQADRKQAFYACCDVVNRGPAVWGDKVFVGVIDGRLIALDRATGKLVWETLTIEKGQPYTITGAPRVAKGKVIIGNGGAEFGVRGYVSAYDADTGKMAWRFYTVPGNPADGFENAAMATAAQTWTCLLYTSPSPRD